MDTSICISGQPTNVRCYRSILPAGVRKFHVFIAALDDNRYISFRFFPKSARVLVVAIGPWGEIRNDFVCVGTRFRFLFGRILRTSCVSSGWIPSTILRSSVDPTSHRIEKFRTIMRAVLWLWYSYHRHTLEVDRPHVCEYCVPTGSNFILP